MLTVAEACEAVRGGQVVRLSVGADLDDPVLLVWVDEGMVMSYAIGGWSAGVVEPVCGKGSTYLESDYFAGTREMVVATDGEAARAREIHYEW